MFPSKPGSGEGGMCCKAPARVNGPPRPVPREVVCEGRGRTRTVAGGERGKGAGENIGSGGNREGGGAAADVDPIAPLLGTLVVL